LRRKRPGGELLGSRAGLVTMPGSFSFPSGHSASAFAFATGVARAWPAAGVPIAGVAGLVAYSRAYSGVHFPGDVFAGAGLGIAAGIAANVALRDQPVIQLPEPEPDAIPKRAVLLVSEDAGSSQLLHPALAELERSGIDVVDRIPVQKKSKLQEIAQLPAEQRPLVIAAGGDGTVGAAADELAGTGAIMAILPLGTSNDVARSLGINPDPIRAARELSGGVVRAIDAGQVSGSGEQSRHFIHAATVGLNVDFAKLATASALRRRFGRLTYAVAGARALRQHRPFDCELRYDGTHEKLRLVQLSIVNAPVFGGALDLRVPNARLDDRSLVVIAVEEGSPVRLLLGAVLTMIGRRREAAGVRAVRTTQLNVHVERPLDMALDGEIGTTLPADFEVAAEALRVVTPKLKHHRA
jgi:diacylglycerol kinase (ATP)